MRRHLLAIAVILTVGTGCDNVAWGGVEVELMPPPSSEPAPADEGTLVEQDTPARRIGPLLLAGLRDGSRATLALVGEIRDGSLSAFPDPQYPDDRERVAELIGVGSEWILFSEGVRVGRLMADQVRTEGGFCPPRATVSGLVELLPEAAGTERLLALPAAAATARPYGEYRPLARDYDQGVASLAIAGEVIPRVGAPWPPEGVLAARADIQAFQPQGVGGQVFAATFLHRDELAAVPPGQGAYAVFVLGVPSGDGYREGYSSYRAVDTEGKGAPRYFSHLDWDGDGESEILLDVFGGSRRWFVGLTLREGEWVRSFQDACDSGSTAGR
jgi:hypothetical protein